MNPRNIFILLSLFVLPLSALETTIEGGKMELLNKGDIVFFRDGVHLRRGGDWMQAREMKTTKKRDKVTAWGKVKLFRKISENEKIQGFGKQGFYDTNTGKGYLLGGFKRAHFIYYETISPNVKRRVDLYGKRLDFFREQSRALAKENVYGTTIDPESGEKYEFWADQAEYFGDEKKIVLTGKKKPRVLQTLKEEKKRISGETIIYYIEPKKFIADGKAKAIFEDPKNKDEDE